jgi:hypothetical protein
MPSPPEPALARLAALRRFTAVRGLSLAVKLAALVLILVLIARATGGP